MDITDLTPPFTRTHIYIQAEYGEPVVQLRLYQHCLTTHTLDFGDSDYLHSRISEITAELDAERAERECCHMLVGEENDHSEPDCF